MAAFLAGGLEMATKDEHPIRDSKPEKEKGLNRRDFVKSGVAAGLGAGGALLEPKKAQAQVAPASAANADWHYEVDVVIAGGGCAGRTAGRRGHRRGGEPDADPSRRAGTRRLHLRRLHPRLLHADERDQELGAENIIARLADPTWRRPFHIDKKVWRVDVYNMGTFFYEGIYIGMPAMFHSTGPVPNYPNTDGFHLVQLATSRDLKNWKRLGDRRPFIGPSRLQSGAYDLVQILPPSAPVEHGDELWFYYTGLKYRASFIYVGRYPNGKYVTKPGLEADRGAICLAVLRRDGFVSLDAGEKSGQLVTRPMVLPGGKMHVNVDAVDGELGVEVLDAEDKVVAVSEEVNGELARKEILWKRGTLSQLKGKAVTLRFTLRNARFYSYWFK